MFSAKIRRGTQRCVPNQRGHSAQFRLSPIRLSVVVRCPLCPLGAGHLGGGWAPSPLGTLGHLALPVPAGTRLIGKHPEGTPWGHQKGQPELSRMSLRGRDAALCPGHLHSKGFWICRGSSSRTPWAQSHWARLIHAGVEQPEAKTGRQLSRRTCLDLLGPGHARPRIVPGNHGDSGSGRSCRGEPAPKSLSRARDVSGDGALCPQSKGTERSIQAVPLE